MEINCIVLYCIVLLLSDYYYRIIIIVLFLQGGCARSLRAVPTRYAHRATFAGTTLPPIALAAALVSMLPIALAAALMSIKPFISYNLIVKITIYTHTIDKLKQITKTLWAI